MLSLDQQAQRAYQQLQRQGSDLAKNVYLEQLHDRNEVLSGASKVTAGMLIAAAEAVAGQVDVSAPGASLLSAVENLRASSATTAVAVARAAADDGVATKKADNLVQAVQDAMWQPAYSDRQE